MMMIDDDDEIRQEIILKHENPARLVSIALSWNPKYQQKGQWDQRDLPAFPLDSY